MNWPGRRRESICLRTRFHSEGSICHSSMSRGTSPLRRSDGSTSRAARICGSPESSATSEEACCRPVMVLPQARTPSMRMPPE